MKLEYDPAKRQQTLAERGLDFERADDVLLGESLTRIDRRKDYVEVRFITLGALDGHCVVLVWTRRSDAVRVISLRSGNDDEREIYREHVDRSR